MKFLETLPSFNDLNKNIYRENSSEVKTPTNNPETESKEESISNILSRYSKDPESDKGAIEETASFFVDKNIPAKKIEAYLQKLPDKLDKQAISALKTLGGSEEKLKSILDRKKEPASFSPEESEKLLKIEPEKFLEAFSKEGGKDKEGKNIPSRLENVTKERLSPSAIQEGSEVTFNFMFDGKFNESLWMKTTAGQVLPKNVKEVEAADGTYTRRGFGEFFNGNKRLKIHGDEEHGYTNIKIKKLSTAEEIKKMEGNAQKTATQTLEKAGIKLPEKSYARLLEATKMGSLRGIDPKLTLALARSEFFTKIKDESEFKSKFEEALTESHRIQDGQEFNQLTGMDGKHKLNYALGVLAPYISSKEARKSVLTDIGYKPENIDEAENSYSRSSVDIGKFGNVDLLKQPGFASKLNSIAADLGVTPGDMMQVFKFETAGSFNPAITNGIGATGLIQFMPKTARGLGTSTAALRKMSATEQLDWVHKYFRPYKGRMNGVEDLYLATFYPAAIGKPKHHVIGSEKSSGWAAKVARQNPAISKGKSRITVSDVKRAILTT